MINRGFDNLVPDIDFSELTFKAKPKPIVSVEPKPETAYQKEGPMSMPPGLIGEIAKFIYSASYKPVPEMSIVGAIGMLAGIAGKAYNVSGTGLNVYLLLLARTGRGKEEIAKGVGKLFHELQKICPTSQDFQGPGDLASGQGLLRYLSTHNSCSFISIFGEFGIKLKSICRSGANQADVMTQRVLLDLFNKSGPSDALYPTVYSDSEKNTGTIKSPAVSIIGESTPEWFYDNVDDSMIRSGLLPRFCVVEYLGFRPASNHTAKNVTVPPELTERLATLVSVVQGFLQGNQRCVVQFSEEAHKASVDFDTYCDNEINTGDPDSMSVELWNRAHLKTLRLAGLLAVGKNPYAPTVDMECWEWAKKFVIDGIHNLKKRFDGGSIGNNTEAGQHTELEKLLKGYLTNRPHCSSVTDEVYSRGVIPHTYLLSKLRKKKVFETDRAGASNAIARTIRNFEDAGDLARIPPMQSSHLFQSNGKFYVIQGGYS